MKAIVTGAAGGIGSECVRQLIYERQIDVIAISRSKDALDALVKEMNAIRPGSIKALVCDFHESGFEDKIYEHAMAHGPVSYLINNAGLLINKPFEDLTREEVEAQMYINYTAPLLLIRKLIPLLRANGQGHVVNIGSMGGYQGSDKFPGLSAYSSSKGALAILSECLAAEFAGQGIQFNCLALGSANTEMLKLAFPDYESPTSPRDMASFIVDFTLNGWRYFNGKVLPVAGTAT